MTSGTRSPVRGPWVSSETGPKVPGSAGAKKGFCSASGPPLNTGLVLPERGRARERERERQKVYVDPTESFIFFTDRKFFESPV